jgi:hypothetical protein
VCHLDRRLSNPPTCTWQQIPKQIVRAALEELVADEREQDQADRDQDRPTEVDVGEVLEERHVSSVTRPVRRSNGGGARTHHNPTVPGKTEAAPWETAPLRDAIGGEEERDRRSGGIWLSVEASDSGVASGYPGDPARD